jgi:hypothetical protein
MPHISAAIPDDLLQQLRSATEKFQNSCRELEKWMDASEYRHQERITRAEAQLHEAERDVLNVEARIRKILTAANAQSADIQH